MLVALAAPGVELPTSQLSPPPYAYRAACRYARLPDVVVPADDRAELIAKIRVWEGEAMEQPPLMFKAVVALGTAMLSGAGLLLVGLVV